MLSEGYKFVSATYRLFKVPKPSSAEKCVVMYDGNVTGSEETLEFDAQHTFKVQLLYCSISVYCTIHPFCLNQIWLNPDVNGCHVDICGDVWQPWSFKRSWHGLSVAEVFCSSFVSSVYLYSYLIKQQHPWKRHEPIKPLVLSWHNRRPQARFCLYLSHGRANTSLTAFHLL